MEFEYNREITICKFNHGKLKAFHGISGFDVGAPESVCCGIDLGSLKKEHLEGIKSLCEKAKGGKGALEKPQ
jgi:hypothetical protein